MIHRLPHVNNKGDRGLVHRVVVMAIRHGKSVIRRERSKFTPYSASVVFIYLLKSRVAITRPMMVRIIRDKRARHALVRRPRVRQLILPELRAS